MSGTLAEFPSWEGPRVGRFMGSFRDLTIAHPNHTGHDELLSHMQQKIAPVETPVQGTPPKSGNEGLTKAFATVISE